MRMNREEAARNRDRVVRTASELFRENGYDGIGIAGLMKAAGLTNGAFYKQFDSKEALVAEATAFGLKENMQAWQEVLNEADNPLQALTEWYLSNLHMQHRGQGCCYAALASEAPRHDEALRLAFEDGLQASINLLSDSARVERAEAIRHMSRLIGALMLARSVVDPKLSEQILEANGWASTPGQE